MRVARVAVESENPEIAAFKALADWARKNVPGALKKTRFFGFNDPCPEPGQTVYRYEAWMSIDEQTGGTDDVSVIVHPGGKYAVVTTSLAEISDVWHWLDRAVKENGYEYGTGPALEEMLTDPIDTPFDRAVVKLYLPVK